MELRTSLVAQKKRPSTKATKSQFVLAKFDLAQMSVGQPNVRFGSEADVTSLNRDVRFTPESGHPAQQHSKFSPEVTGFDSVFLSVGLCRKKRSRIKI
jgi:hypothetical protein